MSMYRDYVWAMTVWAMTARSRAAYYRKAKTGRTELAQADGEKPRPQRRRSVRRNKPQRRGRWPRGVETVRFRPGTNRCGDLAPLTLRGFLWGHTLLAITTWAITTWAMSACCMNSRGGHDYGGHNYMGHNYRPYEPSRRSPFQRVHLLTTAHTRVLLVCAHVCTHVEKLNPRGIHVQCGTNRWWGMIMHRAQCIQAAIMHRPHHT